MPDNRSRNSSRAKDQFGDDAVAEVITRLESRVEAERFFTKFFQVWDLAEEDGVDENETQMANMQSPDIDEIIAIADELGQFATKQHTEHASEIRRHITELKAMVKGR